MTDRYTFWGGRHAERDYPEYLSIRRVLLDKGGYARRGQPAPEGRYFGVGLPLWSVQSDDLDVDFFMRMPSLVEARAEVRRLYPKAKLARGRRR